MSNPTKQLTLADLEAAKEWHSGEAAQFRYHEKSHKMHDIAATCIGIVEEMMVKTDAEKGSFKKAVALLDIYDKAVAAFVGEVRNEENHT